MKRAICIALLMSCILLMTACNSGGASGNTEPATQAETEISTVGKETTPPTAATEPSTQEPTAKAESSSPASSEAQEENKQPLNHTQEEQPSPDTERSLVEQPDQTSEQDEDYSSQNNDRAEENRSSDHIAEQTREVDQMALQMIIGNTPVTVAWEDNDAVQALKELCRNQPLTIHMSMYGGFEQVGSIGSDLPRNDVQTTTSSGDIVLYSGNQLVVFYGTNSWAYTRLGHITDQDADGMAQLLSNGDVEIVISLN